MEGSGHGLIEVTSGYFPGGTEENHKNIGQDSRCPSRDSNTALPALTPLPLPLLLTVPASCSSSSVLLLVALCGCGWLYLSLLFIYGRQ
jgi:hypothetical protein